MSLQSVHINESKLQTNPIPIFASSFQELSYENIRFLLQPTNYSRHSEILNLRKNSKSTSFSFENCNFTVFHFKDSLCLQKLTNLDAKGAKRSVNLKRVFSKIFFFTRMVGFQKFVHCIRTE